MIKAAITGGAGYNAGELLRILLNHPDVEVAWVNSADNAGKRIDSVHQGLIGDTDLTFTDALDWNGINILFCCTPHGETRAFLEKNTCLPHDLRIIDLSTDFRLEEPDNDFVYGLPELNRKKIVRGALHIANPGCFATAIELALLPLAQNNLIRSDIHVSAIIGSSAAGVKPTASTHFSWQNDNISLYNPLRHRHLPEIRQTLEHLQPDIKDYEINFIPMRGCFFRGIFAVTYLRCTRPLQELTRLYEEYYSDHRFTFVSDRTPDLKDIVNTNKCIIHLERVDDKLVITSVIDNLLKGAAGTAVHNMNLLFGLSELTGLKLKPSAY